MYIFQPIAIETLGAFGGCAIEFGHWKQAVCQDTRVRMFLMQRVTREIRLVWH